MCWINVPFGHTGEREEQRIEPRVVEALADVMSGREPEPLLVLRDRGELSLKSALGSSALRVLLDQAVRTALDPLVPCVALLVGRQALFVVERLEQNADSLAVHLGDRVLELDGRAAKKSGDGSAHPTLEDYQPGLGPAWTIARQWLLARFRWDGGLSRKVGEMDESSRRRAEAAGVEVEAGEARCVLEIDVQPLASGPLGMVSREADEVGRDSAPLKVGPGLGVQQEGVIAAVPGDVHKTDGGSVREMSGRPPEAVGPDSIPPASLGVSAVRARQGEDLIVPDREAPPVFDVGRHAKSMSRPRREENPHQRRTESMVART